MGHRGGRLYLILMDVEQTWKLHPLRSQMLKYREKLIKLNKEAVNGAFAMFFLLCHIFDNLKSSQRNLNWIP
jgi:hypothetical protein